MANLESKTKLYNSWRGMRERCNNPRNKAYKYYGGKGIKTLNTWKHFINFKEWAYLNGYEEGLTIDRIDSNKDYIPSNCVWITHVDNVIKANKSRYKSRKESAKEYWLGTKCTGVTLSKVFEVSFSAGCKWIREWKMEVSEKGKEAREALEDMVNRRIDNTGESREEATKHIIKYIESTYEPK